MSFKIGFLFLHPADLALICWLKVETFLNDSTHVKPSSRVEELFFLQLCTCSPDLAMFAIRMLADVKEESYPIGEKF